jgi:hypothetical protein
MYFAWWVIPFHWRVLAVKAHRRPRQCPGAPPFSLRFSAPPALASYLVILSKIIDIQILIPSGPQGRLFREAGVGSSSGHSVRGVRFQAPLFCLDHRTSRATLISVGVDYEALIPESGCGFPAMEQRTGVAVLNAQVLTHEEDTQKRLWRSPRMEQRTVGSYNQWLEARSWPKRILLLTDVITCCQRAAGI